MYYIIHYFSSWACLKCNKYRVTVRGPPKLYKFKSQIDATVQDKKKRISSKCLYVYRVFENNSFFMYLLNIFFSK